MKSTEREAILNELSASEQSLRKAVEGLDDARWRAKPNPERWSVGQCVEHIVIVENRILSFLGSALEREPDPDFRSERTDEVVQKAARNREVRIQAPPGMEQGEPRPKAEALDAFAETRKKVAEFVSGAKHDLRRYSAPHRRLGKLDVYQWLLFLTGHCDRHVDQMEEVKQELAK